jgi:putative ABC transport system ATP-binding protein
MKSVEVLKGRDLTLTFGEALALDGVSVSVAAGELVAVTGPSGCGKSTLLHVLSGILSPTSGTVEFGGSDLATLGDAGRSRLRLRSCGFVFQFGDLVPELTLRENTELPLRLQGCSAREARRRATVLLEELDVAQHADRRPSQVSGGQAQRAAVARALIHDPALIFADEPTGALDSTAGAAVLEAFVSAVRRRGAAVVMVTHAGEVADRADRIISMRDGRIVAGDIAAPAAAGGLR